MSASGYKQTFKGLLANVRFAPNSGHSDAQKRAGLKKRTLDVRFLNPSFFCASECLLSGVKRTFASYLLNVRL